MLKKVIPIAIALCLIFSISVMAENTSAVTDGAAAGASQQMPQGERPQGGRGNMGMPPRGDMQGRTPPNMPNGEMPQGEFTPPEGFTPPDGEFTPPQNAGEFTPLQNDVKTNGTEATESNVDAGIAEKNQQTQENGEQSGQTQGGNQQFGGQMPGGMGGFPGNMQNFNGQTQEEQPKGFLGFVKTYSTPITSVVLLGLAFIFVIFYRRKNY